MFIRSGCRCTKSKEIRSSTVKLWGKSTFQTQKAGEGSQRWEEEETNPCKENRSLGESVQSVLIPNWFGWRLWIRFDIRREVGDQVNFESWGSGVHSRQGFVAALNGPYTQPLVFHSICAFLLVQAISSIHILHLGANP